MLKYVKEGALDLLAFTLPSSLIESIRQVSDDDFLSPEWGHQQRQPRMRRHNTTSSSSSRAVAPTQRHLLTTKESSGGVFSVGKKRASSSEDGALCRHFFLFCVACAHAYESWFPKEDEGIPAGPPFLLPLLLT